MDNQHKNFRKAIKNLKSNAEKGNLLSMFQLFESYSSGKNVEAASDELSKKYFEMIVDDLSKSYFSIDSIRLYDFRRFEDFEIQFDSNITVIIGDNGAGKTSITEAIAKLLSWFSHNLVKSNVNGKKIHESDINVNCESYSEIVGRFKLGDKSPMDISLALPIQGYAGSISSSVAQSKLMGDMYREVASKKVIELPFFAFYSVERSNVRLPKFSSDKTFSDLSNSRFNALRDGLEASTQLEEFSRRYIELYNLAEGEMSPEVAEKKRNISYLENLIEKLSKGKSLIENSELVDELKSAKSELAALMGNQSVRYSLMLQKVNLAIETLVPDVRKLQVDRSTGNQRILLENFGNTVNVTQLSQGQKSLLALSGDLALRLVTLNPDSPNALHTNGVVLIDEIELHLHPKWQQEVVLGLQKTFPNIQFILTTHSPQVLSTVDKKCIRQICVDDNGQLTVITPRFQTKGVTSADILIRIMETNSTPEKLEEAGWLNDFSRYLQAGDQVSLERVFTRIKTHFGNDHPVVSDCESQIRIREMKARLQRD
ncbi:retron Ec78 anti-phage system effector ATPase PtuA [Rheinheimera maricola]|uniref:AAA family ATPase n=1 Tax=Rheinheimera maricola TaxID=2793282 RepID=A0ABS7XC59_9GAMM|nr:retron Ec78 anti-phage system effector ATPase PtuA [Rheinheimera maricola]MBZ9612342.1 AAA family ATPase [Rheinheimera maricola]